MALSITKLHSLLSLIIFLLMVASKVQSQVTVSFAFDTFDANSTYLTYQGDANVPPGSKFVRLIKTDAQGTPQGISVGRVLLSTPLQLWERATQTQASFETLIQFIVTPFQDSTADGMAFFIAPLNSLIPPNSVGGYLGIFNSSGASSSVFAVEFDTYVNNGPGPDPNFRHIGIDINSWRSSNVTRFDGPGTLGEVVTAKITYDSGSKTISVFAFTNTTTFTVSYVFDLRSVLPERVQVGISAATGGLAASFDVRTWRFVSTLR